MSTSYVVTIGERQFKVKLLGDDLVEIDGQRKKMNFIRLSENHYTLHLDHAVMSVLGNPVFEEGTTSSRSSTVRVSINTREFVATVDDHRSLLLKSLTQKETRTSNTYVVVSPMPGMVVKVEVREGDSITKGEGLVILEAMKMENELKAPVNGRISSVHVHGGAAVEKGEKLVTIQTETH